MKNGTESEFGTLYPAVSKGRNCIEVFNLQKTTVNPYAVYKDVGIGMIIIRREHIRLI